MELRFTIDLRGDIAEVATKHFKDTDVGDPWTSCLVDAAYRMRFPTASALTEVEAAFELEKPEPENGPETRSSLR